MSSIDKDIIRTLEPEAFTYQEKLDLSLKYTIQNRVDELLGDTKEKYENSKSEIDILAQDLQKLKEMNTELSKMVEQRKIRDKKLRKNIKQVESKTSELNSKKIEYRNIRLKNL